MKNRSLIYSNSEICLLSLRGGFLFEEKGELLTTIEGRLMGEEIIIDIINSADGDYIFQAQVLAAMKPTGW